MNVNQFFFATSFGMCYGIRYPTEHTKFSGVKYFSAIISVPVGGDRAIRTDIDLHNMHPHAEGVILTFQNANELPDFFGGGGRLTLSTKKHHLITTDVIDSTVMVSEDGQECIVTNDNTSTGPSLSNRKSVLNYSTKTCVQACKNEISLRMCKCLDPSVNIVFACPAQGCKKLKVDVKMCFHLADMKKAIMEKYNFTNSIDGAIMRYRAIAEIAWMQEQCLARIRSEQLGCKDRCPCYCRNIDYTMSHVSTDWPHPAYYHALNQSGIDMADPNVEYMHRFC